MAVPLVVSPQAVSGVLAVLMPVGGWMGYRRKRSIPSLAGGTLVGAMFAYAWWQLRAGSSPDARSSGMTTAVTASILLFVVMGIRLVKTRKVVPAVLAGIAGLAAFYFSQEM